MKFDESFDDVLLVPQFSEIKSRRDVNLSTNIGNLELKLPIISSNMDTVTGPNMAKAMREHGAVGALHRFMTITENLNQYLESPKDTIVSIGLDQDELTRADLLYNAGARFFLIDIAHGASRECVYQYNELIKRFGKTADIIVGNFATGNEINKFLELVSVTPAAFKIGIGGGSACTTRIKTGCGMPTFASIIDCAKTGQKLIADGGMKTPGDIAKALAAGAHAVMLGNMLAGTEESISVTEKRNQIKKTIDSLPNGFIIDPFYSNIRFVEYRGSASKESYAIQGKTESWRTAEGESFSVPYKGSVSSVLQEIEGGLRSSFSYMNSKNLQEFHRNAEFITITSAGIKENGAHGKHV